MATVDKNFKVKNGLVVEGTTATVDGSDIITEDILLGGTQTNIAVTYDAQTKTVSFVAENGVADSTTDDLTEGTTNKYFTDQRAVDAVINGAVDTDDIEEGSTNLYFTEQRAIDAVGGSATSLNTPNTVVKRDGNGDFAAGMITADLTGDVTGQVSDISNHSTTDLAEGTNLYYTDQRVDDYINASIDTDDVSEGSTNLYFTNSRAQSAVAGDISTAVSDHNALTTGVHGVTGDVVGTSDAQALTNKTLGTGTQLTADLDANTHKITNLVSPTLTADAATKGYVDTKVADLVDGAPALLDTLNELAAAIGDDENFVTTITTSIGEKVAKSGDTMTGELVLSGDPTNVLGAAPKQYVDQAEADAVSSANDYTDTAIAAGDATATPTYLALNINDVAKQIAAVVPNGLTGGELAYSFAHADYRSAKLTVKIEYNGHTQISDILLTLDSSNNIAVTEYAIVETNTSLGTILPQSDSSNVSIFVDLAHEPSKITTVGTLIA